MAWLEEWEEQLGGRVKSVLILALAAFLLVEYNNGNIIYRMVEPADSGKVAIYGEEAAVPMTAPAGYENPIDSYFQEVEASVPQELQGRFYLIYLECWETELVHAYNLLAQKLPASFFEEDGYGTDGQEAFWDFTLAQGYLESYYGNDLTAEDMATGRDVKIGENVETEGIVKAGNDARTRLELTRAQTLRIYQLILKEQNWNAELTGLFSFEEESARVMLVNSGILSK